MSTTAAYLTQTAASVIIDPKNPMGPDAMVRWHDRIGGPRDTARRRIWTTELCEQIRAARAKARVVRAASAVSARGA
jgi:hypothetical protein